MNVNGTNRALSYYLASKLKNVMSSVNVRFTTVEKCPGQLRHNIFVIELRKEIERKNRANRNRDNQSVLRNLQLLFHNFKMSRNICEIL